MKNFQQILLASILAAATAIPTAAQCVPTLAPVGDVKVSFMPSVSEKVPRRERVEISDDLAAALGITAADVTGDPSAPHPQIRLRTATAPLLSGIAGNNSVFTVVAIRTIAGTDKRVWVHQGPAASPNDKNSGRFKLFGKTDLSIYATVDTTPADGMVDNVTLNAFNIPVSSSAFTTSGGTTTTTFYCEPGATTTYVEKASRKADDQVVVIAPHGGNIETGTSTQANTFASRLETLNTTPVNVWNLEGKWGSSQTFERWHVTARSFDMASYPGLAALLPAGGTFDYAVAFHGFAGEDDAVACDAGPHEDTNRFLYQIILGGGATRNLKCAIAKALDAAQAAAGRTDDIGISLRDEVDGDIEIEDNCGRPVTEDDFSGVEHDNIVNRLAAAGGIQIEQSKVLREDATLADLVPKAIAKGLADYMANSGTNYCTGL